MVNVERSMPWWRGFGGFRCDCRKNRTRVSPEPQLALFSTDKRILDLKLIGVYSERGNKKVDQVC